MKSMKGQTERCFYFMVCNTLPASDGVTGCGIVAALTLIVEQLRSEQVVNVYRTVVKLLRARQQFITSEVRQATVSAGHGNCFAHIFSMKC